MNAGRDVERLISSWLTEEASDRSRDRVLAEVRQAVHRMPQRRFGAAWRNPMYLSPVRIAAMAAALAIAVVGGAVIGRMTAPSSPAAAAATPTPSLGAGAEALDAYRQARRDICVDYTRQATPLKAQVDGMFDTALTPSERGAKVTALTQFLTLSQAMAGELAALQAPPDILVEHVAAVEDLAGINGLIEQELTLLGEGKLEGAEALDLATDPLARQIEAFEQANRLSPCP